MLRYLIHRPIGVILTFMMIVVMGLYVFTRTSIALLPETDLPYLSIFVKYPSGNANIIEKEITKVIRLQMLQVAGVDDVWSTSQNGRAELELRFRYGKDMSLAYIEANEKLDQIISSLPKDLERPIVNYSSLSDLPVMQISLHPRDDSLTDFVDFGMFSKNVVKRRLEQLDEVAFVDISGYDEAEIQISPDYKKMMALGIDESHLRETLDKNNINLGSILLKDGQYQFEVSIRSQFQSLDDIKNMGIPIHGQILRFRDLATIEKKTKDLRGKFFDGPQRSILLSILKQPESNIFNLRAEVLQTLDYLSQEYPEIELKAILDQSEVLRVSIDNLTSSLLYGGLFAIAILFLFYRRVSALFLITLVIPSTLVSSLLLYYVFGLSINIISLSGLILGVGLMIDNSIIIIENITQFRQQNHNMTEASILGANEVFSPLLSSMLTTCSVFVPLLFMSGIVGSLFYEQALSIAISIFMSLLIAYLVIPVLIQLFGFDFALSKSSNWLEKYHHNLLHFSLRKPLIILLFFGVLITAAIFLIPKLEKTSFPDISREGIEWTIDWNQNITLAENQRRSFELMDHLDHYSEDMYLLMGEQQFLLDRNNQNIQQSKIICMQSNDEKQRHLIQRVEQFCHQKYPFTRLKYGYIENAFDKIFKSDPYDLYVELRPQNRSQPLDITTLNTYLDQIRDQGFEVEPVQQLDKLSIHIDVHKALVYQVNVDDIKQKLTSMLNANQLGTLHNNHENIAITIHQNSEDFETLLQQTMIANASDSLLGLSNFVKTDYDIDYKEITATRKGEAQIIALDNIDQAKLLNLKSVFNSLLELDIDITGPYFQNQQRIVELLWVLLVSLCLLFLILSAQFESLVLPFVILLTLPFGIAGSLILLFLADQALSILSMIGIVVMAGIMVNDAILKLDMINRLSPKLGVEAALFEAGQRRIKPILMTSITTILALCPILLSSGLGAELQSPLALAVIGGIAMGTLSSVTILPIIYLLCTRNFSFFKKYKAQ